MHIRSQRVTEVLNPQSKMPDYSLMMKFLNVLNVAKCSICGTFFEIYIVKDEDYKSFHRLVRPKYFEAIRDNPKADVLDAEELKRIKTKVSDL